MILVGGIGNILLGDDAFGSEVARKLLQGTSRENVRVVDFGIREVDLVYSLLDPLDGVILINAMKRGGKPGTLYVLEPALPSPDIALPPVSIDGHRLDPVAALTLAFRLGAKLKKVRIIGCEPEYLGNPDEGDFGLSDCLRAAVDEAVLLVESQIEEMSHKRKQDLGCRP